MFFLHNVHYLQVHVYTCIVKNTYHTVRWSHTCMYVQVATAHVHTCTCSAKESNSKLHRTFAVLRYIMRSLRVLCWASSSPSFLSPSGSPTLSSAGTLYNLSTRVVGLAVFSGLRRAAGGTELADCRVLASEALGDSALP